MQLHLRPLPHTPARQSTACTPLLVAQHSCVLLLTPVDDHGRDARARQQLARVTAQGCVEQGAGTHGRSHHTTQDALKGCHVLF